MVLEFARLGARVKLFVTGQHPGLDLADHGLAHVPSHRLACPGRRDPLAHVEDVGAELARLWCGAAPDLVMVQGDTSSALGGARAAVACAAPLAHVEAGLRSFDLSSPWPEEQFRTEIDRLSDILFAPTTGAAANLRRENLDGALHITGNSGIDALLAQLDAMPAAARRTRRRGPLRLLVTCHRRENWGTGLTSLALALIALARRGDVVIDAVLIPTRRSHGRCSLCSTANPASASSPRSAIAR